MSIVSAWTMGAIASKKASDVLAGQVADRVGERGRGEGAGGDDDAVPIGGRQRRPPRARVSRSGRARAAPRPRRRTRRDRPRARRRPAAGAHPPRAGPGSRSAAHLLVQQPDRVVVGIVGAERVGADQFGEPARRMRLGPAHGPHLVQHHGHAGARQLPRRLAAGEAAADDMNRLPNVKLTPSGAGR